ncbi:hypothetical protein WBJ53_33240 (plasmid) [Spirosoma sp. SC4-14]|uniref:hypothetical protein n=1 Tax=Spirosoma sp. SC4-14 TaxID=3128900 RepID=UPI0030CA692C
MKHYVLFLALLIPGLGAFRPPKKPAITYVSSFQNVTHPEVAYWFFSKDMLEPKRYREKIDSLSQFSKYTLIFLTARNGVNFYDAPAMHPIFQDVVAYAHNKGLQIGLQLWDKRRTVALENTERIMQEGEVVLDATGGGTYTTTAKHVRDKKQLLRSELFRVYAFKKTADGFYDPATLTDITRQCTPTESKETVSVVIHGDKALQGYTAYILSQHYYNYTSNHRTQAIADLTAILKAYADIPFDGVGLDEYTNLRVSTTWELKNGDVFRERPYSLAMAAAFKRTYGHDLERTLFDMRYAPTGKPDVRMKAINAYMATMRAGTMGVERTIYNQGKAIFGKNTFIGLHDTHHNSLDGDEIWQTGLNWWNVKRDYGHTDEHSPTPTQLGIGMSYPENVLYNMYYDKSVDNIAEKALTDLRYGIRTHYHAINDVQNWGVSVEKPVALTKINPVENAARLLNRFNPSFPQVRLLVVFGMEALSNWYPDASQRNLMDINGKLGIEEKAKQLWNAGYRNALVPTDIIADGRLQIGADGKPVLQGHTFDAVVLLYPEYAKKSTLQFLEKYIEKGGKLMTEGPATHDFDGNDLTARWKKIADKAIVNHFSVDAIAQLGISKNGLPNGALNEDGSYTFTDYASLTSGSDATFSATFQGDTYQGTYRGLAAILATKSGGLQKLAATGLTELRKNGQVVFRLDQPHDIFFDSLRGLFIADAAKAIKPSINDL